MDILYSLFKIIFIGGEVLLFFGIVPIVHATIIPAIPFVLGMATVSGKGRWLGFFLGFQLSYAFFQIVQSYIMHVANLSYQTLQKVGILFLALFGLMMLFPHYAIWNKEKDDYRKAKRYGILFGFIWSFWEAAIPKNSFTEFDILSLFLLFYFSLVLTLVPALFFLLIAFVFAKLCPEKYLPSIEKGIGWLTLLLSCLLFFGIIKTPTL